MAALMLSAEDHRHLVAQRFEGSAVLAAAVLSGIELARVTTHRFDPSDILLAAACDASESRAA